MSSAEFAEWMAYYQVEPFGSTADDIRFGTLATASVAPWGGKTAPDEWFSWSKQQEKAWGTWQDLKAAMGGVSVPAVGDGSAGPELMAEAIEQEQSEPEEVGENGK